MFAIAPWYDSMIDTWLNWCVTVSNIIWLIIIVVNYAPYFFICDCVLIIHKVLLFIFTTVGVIDVFIIRVILIVIIVNIVNWIVKPIYVLVIINNDIYWYLFKHVYAVY